MLSFLMFKHEVNKTGDTPLLLYLNFVAKKLQLEIVKAFIEKNVNVHHGNKKGITCEKILRECESLMSNSELKILLEVETAQSMKKHNP